MVEHSTADREVPVQIWVPPGFIHFQTFCIKLYLRFGSLLELHNLYRILLLTVIFINCIEGAGKLGGNLAEITFAAAILTFLTFLLKR